MSDTILEEQTISAGPTEGLIGRPLPRKEDAALLTGSARFLADIKFHGMLFTKVLRAPYAHAHITHLDTSAAEQMPGVRSVLTGGDVVGKVEPWGHQTQGHDRGERFPFAVDKVTYEGQEVAAVVADSEYEALDAIEQIDVQYEELPAVVDLYQAMEEESPRLIEGPTYPFRRGNAYHHYKARVGNVAESQAQASAVVSGTFATTRPHAAALEPHGCIADYDAHTGKLTVYSSTQGVHLLRDLLAGAVGLPLNRVQARAVEVGGGFGSKTDLFPHEVIASLFAMRLGRPVRLILSRGEVLRATTARCNQVRESELHASADGTITGWHERILHNAGGGSMWGNQVISLGTQVGLSCYPIPNVHIDGYAIHTNTEPGGSLRGFGVPQTTWAVEQLTDMAASALNMDPIEFRLRNAIKDDQCPYRTPLGHVIDSTSITECIKSVAEASDWERHRSRRQPGEGIGIAAALKHTSARHPAVDTDMSSVLVRVQPDGTVTVYSDNVPHGQGHKTILSQIVADTMGVSYEKINVETGNSDASPFGLGTWGSRGAAVLGAAAEQSAKRARSQIVRIAAHLLECDEDDLAISDDHISVYGVPSRQLSIAEVAGVTAYSTHRLPDGVEAGSIEAKAAYDTPTDILSADGTGNITVTYCGSAHVARVRVDENTGVWGVVDYFIAADSGTVINPLIVEGQQQGAFLHGFGWLLGESLVTDGDGHVVNPSFASYMAPYATEVPDLKNLRELPAPSRVVPGGRKGAGESSTGVTAPAIANALFHATGIRFTELPITPDHVLHALEAKERQGVSSLRYPQDIQRTR